MVVVCYFYHVSVKDDFTFSYKLVNLWSQPLDESYLF